MKRKMFGGCLVVMLILVSMAGCSPALKRKLIRQKDIPASAQPQVYTEKEFIKPYSNEYYYVSHFNAWKVWQEELLKNLDGNAKRNARAADELIA
ncbi:MAG: hypothetical protein HQL11_01475, partial [Candidatus Omnitrophica bacterium]|nr:hypothetical protein [Candidatus Omnitrophota bacterium]